MALRSRLSLLVAASALGLLLFVRCDNVTCKTVVAQLSASCLPDSIDVDREVRIEMREACGQLCPRQPNCTATLVAGVVVLDVNEDQCNDVSTATCPPCQQRVVSCQLPPLPQGDYTMRGPGLPDQVVHVRPGGAAACTLPVLPDAGT